MEKIRVLIADKSSVYTKMFTRAVTEADKNISVSCVSDGDEVLGLINNKNYNIIVIDAEISDPGLTEIINIVLMKNPLAYILAIARPSAANSDLFQDVLSKGATECMTKPIYDSYADNLDIIKQKMNYLITKTMQKNREENEIIPKKPPVKNIICPEIVLIAASTGGPLALNRILSNLRSDFPLPILIVQHIPSYFTETLAVHLDNKSGLKVKIAQDRETVKAGNVYLAPGGMHMKLNSKNNIKLDDSPPIGGLRPAADVLFESVAKSFSGRGVLAVILTGMGSDGRKGLLSLKAKRDCYCIAQSEETCVVYGMPRCAVESGLADKILDLDKIYREIESICYTQV
ncbi:MAG: CheB methylesterase domain-containing protein [Treponema sp.]|nr:CheB methylesterase domain-containing protein [Treponema sp.]